MADNANAKPPSLAEVQERLRDVADRLRASDSVDPESRVTLAELIKELTAVLASAQVPPVEVAHLADSTAHLAELLHQRPDHRILGHARDRLASALVAAEAHAPVAAGLARQALDTLANWGI